ncbi:MAG: hypothetical protein ACOC1P_02770 [Minisyncoccales bacterium]
MVLEISPIDTFNQIKEVNKLLNRNRKKNEEKEQKSTETFFSSEDEIDLRAFILENTSTTELTVISKLIDRCKSMGYFEEDVVSTIQKMIAEKILDTLNERFLLRLDDTD